MAAQGMQTARSQSSVRRQWPEATPPARSCGDSKALRSQGPPDKAALLSPARRLMLTGQVGSRVQRPGARNLPETGAWGWEEAASFEINSSHASGRTQLPCLMPQGAWGRAGASQESRSRSLLSRSTAGQSLWTHLPGCQSGSLRGEPWAPVSAAGPSQRHQHALAVSHTPSPVSSPALELHCRSNCRRRHQRGGSGSSPLPDHGVIKLCPTRLTFSVFDPRLSTPT